MDSHHQPDRSSGHKLAAVMFTDIVGYTAMMGRDENRALKLLRKNRQIQKPLIEKFNGTLIKEMGDGILARFDSAYDAARCAIEIQEAARSDFKGQIRIGLHIGDIYVENNDIFGDGVNIASRIESIADPQSIYLSGAFRKSIQNHNDIRTRYLATVQLKNVLDPVEIYCIEKPGIPKTTNSKIRQLKETGAEKKLINRKFFKNPIFYLLLIILLLFLVTNKYWYNITPYRAVKAIAILPFDNFTGSETEQYFVDMMHDAVITEISKIGGLIVKSRTSTLQFRDTKMTIPQIAKILNVDAVIESSVYKTGDSVYLNVQLIRARPEESHIWANDFKRGTNSILSLYGELAQAVASEVNVQLSPLEEKLLTEKKEVNPEAYKAYLNGLFHWKKLTKEDMELAEQYFLKAIDIDPNYAEAYLGLSGIGGGMAQMGLISSAEANERGEKFLQKALELDSGLWEAHRRVAFSNIWWNWNFKKGMKEFKTTLQLNPNDAMTRAYYAQALCVTYTDYEQAEKEGAYAIQIDPIDKLYQGLYGQTLNFCRKYEKADSVFKVVLDSDPFNAIALSNIKTTYHMQGKHTKALEYWKIDNRKDSLALKALELGYESGGYQGALKALAEYSIEKSSDQFVTPWRIFTIYVRAGMKEESLDWMEKAYEIHDPNMPSINCDPIFDDIRDEPRFQAIFEKMNFPVKN